MGDLGATSQPRAIVLSNPRKTSQGEGLTIESLATTGDFILDQGTTDCKQGLSVGSQCGIGIVFTPTGIGRRLGLLIVRANGKNGVQSAVLSGVGKQGSLTIHPLSLSFPKQKAGSQSTSKIVIVNNKNPIGTYLSVNIDGNFAITATTCSSFLEPTTSCSVSVSFAPGTTGKLVGSVTFTDSAVGSPQKVKLLGTSF
jgi:hypothetical protein